MTYWHTLTESEQKTARKSRATGGMYRQPPWCNYPEAMGGVMGCWSLVLGHIRRRSDCRCCTLERKLVRDGERRGIDVELAVPATAPRS